MEEVITHCSRCKKPIYRGAAYVCIARNIEQVEHSVSAHEDQVEIIQSDMLLSLCGRCGNRFDAGLLEQLIQLIPVSDAGVQDN